MKFLLLFVIFVSPYLAYSREQSAKEFIHNFYDSYLKTANQNKKPHLPFSKSFQTLLDKNRKVCKEKAGTDICGFGADGDIYLNAQETDPKRTFKNSGISISEPSTGTISVKLDVYPGAKKPEFYTRNIGYKLVKQKNKWAVDDILYEGKSARKTIEDEIAFYTKQGKSPKTAK